MAAVPLPFSDRPPGRALLRVAAILTQLSGAACLLLGTIAFVLVQQNKSGGAALVFLWAAAAMAGLVFGGLMARGGLVALFASASLLIGYAAVLLLISQPALRSLLRVLPASDVETIGSVLVVLGVAMLVTSVLCLVAIPQARRYADWMRALAAAEEQDAALSSMAMPLAEILEGATHTATPALQPFRQQAPVSFTQPQPVQSFGSYTQPQPAQSPIPHTRPGFPPPPVRARTTMMIRAQEKKSRRRMYIALGGFAIGVGAGLGVVMSAGSSSAPAAGAGSAGSATAGRGRANGSAAGAQVVTQAPHAGSAAAPVADDLPPVRTLINAERAALAKGDTKAIAALLAPHAFGFGANADEVGEGRDALEAQLRADLGEIPPEGLIVESKFLAAAERDGHAWIAEELEISAPGTEPQRFTITQLAQYESGAWHVLAWHWAHPVPDATAERMAILGTLPPPKAVPNQHDDPGELDKAVRAAFASRAAFAEARSEDAEAFNFGSAPGERIVGGSTIKKLFGRLRAQIRLHDGARVAQVSETIGWAAVNVDFTSKSRAATDLTQTFRVLAVFLREGGTWRIVQTHWSNGGPIR